MTHIYTSKLTITGSDNGFFLGGREAIIWTDAVILLIGPLGTNLSKIVIEIHKFTKMHVKMSTGKWRPFCLDLSVLKMKGTSIYHQVLNQHNLHLCRRFIQTSRMPLKRSVINIIDKSNSVRKKTPTKLWAHKIHLNACPQWQAMELLLWIFLIMNILLKWHHTYVNGNPSLVIWL